MVNENMSMFIGSSYIVSVPITHAAISLDCDWPTACRAIEKKKKN